MSLTDLTVLQIHDLLKTRKASAVEITQAHLAHIEQHDQEVRAYLSLTPERALEQAKKVDEGIAAGKELPPLAGVPVAIKDVIMTEGSKTTCASRILEKLHCTL